MEQEMVDEAFRLISTASRDRASTLSLLGFGLKHLPGSVGNLTALTTLRLNRNQLTSLPESMANLTTLTTLRLGGNPLVSPPAEVCGSGTVAVLAFLRALQRGSVEQWSSKMMVVGEATVGKTSVAKALCGLPFNKAEPQTHGVHVDPLEVEHPHRPGLWMRLNVWDFGGQLEYRATQRFYLTDRSMFLLVWNSREGWRTGGRVKAWLQAIATAAPNSPILIVATHCTNSVTDLDEGDLRRRYPRIAHILKVDCSDGTGLDLLRRHIADQAAALPLMGQRWPSTWAHATEQVTSQPGRWIATYRTDELMADCGMAEEAERRTLRAALHDRGDILHFAHDPYVRETVVLQPAWVDGMITRVLDSQQVVDRGGLLSRAHRAELWRDLDDPGLGAGGAEEQ